MHSLIFLLLSNCNLLHLRNQESDTELRNNENDKKTLLSTSRSREKRVSHKTTLRPDNLGSDTSTCDNNVYQYDNVYLTEMMRYS